MLRSDHLLYILYEAGKTKLLTIFDCTLILGVRVRLADGTNSEGRLEVYYHAEWGTVCDDYFDYIDAGVVCNSLGFGSVLTSLMRHKSK